MLFLVIYEFLADRWKKQMFISSSSSAFIYIHLPFQSQFVIIGICWQYNYWRQEYLRTVLR